QPLKHLCFGERFGVAITRAAAQIPENGIRLRKYPTIIEADGRHGAPGIDGAEFVTLALALKDADDFRPVRHVQMVQKLTDLPAILRGEIVVKCYHLALRSHVLQPRLA